MGKEFGLMKGTVSSHSGLKTGFMTLDSKVTPLRRRLQLGPLNLTNAVGPIWSRVQTEQLGPHHTPTEMWYQ